MQVFFYKFQLVKKFLIFVLVLSSLNLGADEIPPPLGKYVFVKDFEIEGCTKRVGYGAAGGHCLKKEKKLYKIGDVIAVDQFFWDDQVKAFGAKVVVFEQNRNVPLNFIKKID